MHISVMQDSEIDIVEIRISLGIRQNRMAERLGTTPSTLSRWEAGKVPLPNWARKQYERIYSEVNQASEVPQ